MCCLVVEALSWSMIHQAELILDPIERDFLVLDNPIRFSARTLLEVLHKALSLSQATKKMPESPAPDTKRNRYSPGQRR